jgi:hypothetical protein
MRRLTGQRGQACGRFEVAATERTRDVMTDDLQEQCMSRTRMSFISLFTTLECLPFILASLFSLTGAEFFSFVLLHSLTRPAPALQFKRAPSLGPAFLPSHAQLKARVSASPWRTFRCLPAHCCLAVHDYFSHSPPRPLFLFYNTHLLFCHCTTPRH